MNDGAAPGTRSALEDVQAVEVGEVPVENDHVGSETIECLEAGLGGAGAPHFVSRCAAR